MSPTTSRTQFFNPLTTSPRPPLDLTHEIASGLVGPRPVDRPEWHTSNFLDVRPHALYDRLIIPANTTIPDTLYCFCESIGQHERGSWNVRTHETTNMRRGCCLPPPEAFLLQRILFLFDTASDHYDAARFAESHWVEFMIDDGIYYEKPLFIDSRCGSMFELFDHQSPYRRDDGEETNWPANWPGNRLPEVAPEIGNSFMVDGLPGFEHGRVIASMQHFRLNLRGEREFTNGGHPIQLYAILDGIGSPSQCWLG